MSEDPYAVYGGQVAAASADTADPYAAYGGKANGLSAEARQMSPFAAQKFAQSADSGVVASLKRTGSGIVHLPGAVWSAATTPPQNAAEQAVFDAADKVGQGTQALTFMRLVAHPMAQEHIKAQQLRAKAALEKTEGQSGQDAATNFWTGTEHAANMHDIASVVPVVGPMAADIVQRYVSGDKSGAATDVATAVAGPKVAEGVLGGAAKVGSNAISKVAPDLAERLYQSALKPSTTIPLTKRAEIVRTGLDSGIPISQTGAEKLSGLISDLNDTISGKIKAGAQAGQTVDPALIATRTGPLKARFANQVNPTSDLQTIDSATQEFLQNNPNKIPVDQAQALKQGTYQQLKGRAYGELKGATIEAQKALARGIKEELETQFPEIKGLNAQEAKFYNLDSVLEKALNRIGNHQLMGIGTPIAAGAGAAVGGGPGAIAAATMKAVLDNPVVKSRLAIALNKAGRGKISLGMANSRVNQFVNALAQSQGGAGVYQSSNTDQ